MKSLNYTPDGAVLGYYGPDTDKNDLTRIRAREQRCYITWQAVYSMLWGAAALVMGILSSGDLAVATRTTQTNIHRRETLGILFPEETIFFSDTQNNSPTETYWIAFTGLLIGCLMSIGNVIHASLQLKQWEDTQLYSSDMVKGYRPVMWIGRLFIEGSLFAFSMQQSGATDVRYQNMIGLTGVAHIMFWFLTERARGIDMIGILPTSMSIIVLWILIIWQVTTTDMAATTDINYYTVAMLIVTSIYTLIVGVANWLDLNRTRTQINNTKIDYVILQVYDMSLFLCYNVFVFVGFVQLTVNPPKLAGTKCFPCYPLAPFCPLVPVRCNPARHDCVP